MRKYLCLLALLFFPLQAVDERYISGWKEALLKRGMKTFEDPAEQMSSPIKNQELVVKLRNPIYKNGILVTHEGGIIENSDIRIQAKTIQYIRKKDVDIEIHKIEAETDVVVRYKNRIFVGEELEYDFIKKEGTIYFGKTYASPWYMGGGKIDLKSDGSYDAHKVYFTTCENVDSSWDIHAESLNVTKKDLLEAKKIRFRLFHFLKLWLPSFNINLKKHFTSPIFKYKVNWDKSSGPRGSVRYQAYSWKDFATFLRLDYRWARGFGGAIETEYYPEHKRTTFLTKNYLGSDVIPNNLKKKRRYRLQGVYHSISPSGHTKADLTWDKYSDMRMPNDFKSDDFELSTEKKTELTVRHEEKNLIALLHSRIRANTFESTKQDMPTFYATMRPIPIFCNIISNNWVKVAYLDYAYSNKLSPSLSDFSSWRLQNFNEIYRSFHMGPFTLTPNIGVTGIFYSKKPNEDTSDGLGSIFYKALLNTQFFRTYSRHVHTIEPFINFYGQTSPTSRTDEHYIFSINDGFHRENILQFGLKNYLYSIKSKKAKPTFDSNLYANWFLDDLSPMLPRGYLTLNWNLPSVYLWSDFGWNFHRKTLDYSNIRMGWTANEDLALTFEFRHRSRYDYRKADHTNFILDVARRESEILQSPLSDKRNTFLTHIFMRINPLWTCQIESHIGWDRKKESFYNEFKIDLFTMLSTSWKARLSFEHTQADTLRVTWDVFMIKNK